MSIKFSLFLLLVCYCQLTFGQRDKRRAYRCFLITVNEGFVCLPNFTQNIDELFENITEELEAPDFPIPMPLKTFIFEPADPLNVEAYGEFQSNLYMGNKGDDSLLIPLIYQTLLILKTSTRV